MFSTPVDLIRNIQATSTASTPVSRLVSGTRSLLVLASWYENLLVATTSISEYDNATPSTSFLSVEQEWWEDYIRTWIASNIGIDKAWIKPLLLLGPL